MIINLTSVTVESSRASEKISFVHVGFYIKNVQLITEMRNFDEYVLVAGTSCDTIIRIGKFCFNWNSKD